MTCRILIFIAGMLFCLGVIFLGADKPSAGYFVAMVFALLAAWINRGAL